MGSPADRPEDLIRARLPKHPEGSLGDVWWSPVYAALDALVRQRDDLLDAARDLTSEPFGCLNARAFYRLREVVAAVAAADAGPDAPKDKT